MRCAVIQKFGKALDNLLIMKRADLVAHGDNIRVRVSATALNRADLLQRRGLYPAPPGAPTDVPGLEFVGYVDQLGENVTAWKGGERVFGIVAGGSYAEQVVTHQRMVIPVPETLSDTEAAAIPEAFVAAHDALVTQGNMRSGDLVLIHAVAGGVGCAAVQLARVYGSQAIGTAGSEEKLARVAELAPFFPVNYRSEDFREKIEGTFGPSPLDLILDTVGAAYWIRNLEVLRARGRLVLLGTLGGIRAETPLATILSKRLHIKGTVLRSRPLEEKIAATQVFAKEVIPHFSESRLKPVIDSVYPLSQVREATERMEENRNIGKIVLTLSE
jgi:putative PIG3 family NAD(P)H quinone oxidoreductase